MLYVDAVVAGTFTGAAYALVAVSITLMFRSTGVLSFAHAAFATTGAYLYAELAGERGWPSPMAALVALALTVAYGVAIERVAIRPVSRGSATTKLIATLGVLSFTNGLMLLFFGFQPTSSPLLLPDRYLRIGSISITYQQTAVFVIALASAVGLGWFLQRTRFGIAIRAVAQNRDAARLMGVSLPQVARFNWALGSLLAGTAGILLSPLAPVNVVTFTLFLVKALTATLFGGLASLPLTFLGGLAVGVVESLTTIKLSAAGSRELMTLVLVVGLLVFRRSWAVESQQEPAFDALSSRRLLPGSFVDAAAAVRDAAQPVLVPVVIVALGLSIYRGATDEYWGFIGARGLFYVIEALSLVLLVGWSGQVSLMHGAYVGIGAFVSAWLVVEHGVNLALAIPLAALAGILMGAVAGLPALRLTGLQFAIASLAFSGAASSYLFRWEGFTRTFPRGELFGIDLGSDSNLFLVMLPVTAVLYLLVWNVRRSTYGPLLLSSRDAGPTVAHFGADPKRTRMWAFLLASFVAATGGAFYGMLITSFTPQDFSLPLSIGLLLYAVVGGVESLAGPVLAGVLFGVVPQILQQQSGAEANAWPDVISGMVVIALIATRPGGLATIFERRTPEESAAAHAVPVRLGRFDAVVAARAARRNGGGETNGHVPAPVPAAKEVAT